MGVGKGLFESRHPAPMVQIKRTVTVVDQHIIVAVLRVA